MPQDRKFVLKQVAALVKLGVPVSDIERSISFVDKHLPDGADASVWMPTVDDLSEDVTSEAALVDARANWYTSKSVPRKFRRLLDSRQEP